MAAVGALEPGEAGGEVAAAEEGLNGRNGGGWKRAEGFVVVLFVFGEEVVPAELDELPEGSGMGSSGVAEGR